MLYGNPVRQGSTSMETGTVNQFRDRLREHVEKVLADHEPLKVTRRNAGAFVVVGAEDWECEQETLCVLQGPTLMDPITRSAETHAATAGHRPTEAELDEIHRL